MSLPYTVVGNFTGSIYSGSILNEKDTTLFYTSQSTDVWFGFSANDVLEFSVYSTDDDSLVNWSIIGQDKEYKSVTLTYLDTFNVPYDYSYNELIGSFVQYKNSKILISPIVDLNSVDITDGSYKLSYDFVRNLAGSSRFPLSVKDVSPSRTEIKLVPQGDADIAYTSFCVKKFPVRDVAPVLLRATQKCPYDDIYRVMYSSYEANITTLKSMFFLNDDGAVLTFLRNLYEDLIKYTLLTDTQIASGLEPTKISRIQGIRTYFSNYLLQLYESISDFDTIENKFGEFINVRLNKQFEQYSTQNNPDYQAARKFVYDFFFTYFYETAIHVLQTGHQQKYYGYLKNVLNFGNNKFFRILSHDYIDERKSVGDPLTLVVKIDSPLPTDVGQKSTCWVSNFGMVPFVTTVILRNPVKHRTIKISSPNFGSPSAFVSKDNTNKLYSADDLVESDSDTNNIFVNKSMGTLNVDYSDFSNFIVFSSAATRINIFKNKIISLTALSSSLSLLNTRYSASLVTPPVYPYYVEESATATEEINNIIQSFDAYESYLYSSGKYSYSIASGSFVSASYVTTQDTSASMYDRNNRDYLVSNTPEYILNDSDNEEYLTFLAMVGHHFDDIYTYISSLPIEKHVQNELSSSIPTNTLKEMLYSFGWNVDDIIGNLDLNEVYLNSLNSGSFNVMSGEQRLQTIWNRILVTLPGIYKTKGTEECVNYLMSCYGLPSSLISVREYGGTDYSLESEPTYKLDEKTYMAIYSGVNDYIEGPYPSLAQTIEFKFSIDSNVTYSNYQHTNLFTVVPYPFSSSAYASWKLGFHKSPEPYMGEIIFQMGSGSTGASITSSKLPIFNGDIFSVMVRRNDPYFDFEPTSSVNDYPTQYDLVVQRNEDGRCLFYSTSSAYLQSLDNTIFDQYGTFYLSDGGFKGTLDKLSIWTAPIGNLDFEEHVNDLNSYGYSGSNAYQDLLVRIDLDYPKSLYYYLNGSSSVWMDNASSYYSIPNYYSDPLNLSSSLDPTLWSASLAIINDRWLTYHPTGSVEIIARNFPEIIGDSFSASFNGTTCRWDSSSYYPYHYEELTYQQDIDASKYGPNKYKNKKIRKLDYTVEARFDSKDRSTSQSETVSGESNQLGFFIDPQDAKNKDIIRYVGKNGIVELIGDASNIYSDRYYDLISKNAEYHASGNKKTYFNEMLTVFKFYFDKSIFQIIRNVLPARANSFTGVVIEPTILERPKYHNRQITSSADITFQNPVIIDNIYTFSETGLWINFNTDFYAYESGSANYTTLQKAMWDSMPPNYQDTIDLSYASYPTRIRYTNYSSGYVTDFLDKLQHSTYGDYETLTRGWEPQVNCQSPIWGSVSRQKQEDLPSISEHHVPVGIDETGIASGSKHQILYYMLKSWDKYEYHAKTGEYVRSVNPNDDTYASASTFFYKYIMVDERFMKQYVHFYNNITTSIVPNDPSYTIAFIGGDTYYEHAANTFKNTPEQIVSNTTAVFYDDPTFYPTRFNVVNLPSTQYFELARGYPRNHYNHKSTKLSKEKFPRYVSSTANQIFVRGRNTIDSTINRSGISDGTFPVEIFNVSNVNVRNSTNVIQQVPSPTAGAIIPTTTRPIVSVQSPITFIQPTPAAPAPVRCIPFPYQFYSVVGGNPRVISLQLGSGTGTVQCVWDARGAKDRFIMEWDGRVVFDSGCVKGTGTANFFKNKAEPTTAKFTIAACVWGESNGWVLVTCPFGGGPVVQSGGNFIFSGTGQLAAPVGFNASAVNAALQSGLIAQAGATALTAAANAASVKHSYVIGFSGVFGGNKIYAMITDADARLLDVHTSARIHKEQESGPLIYRAGSVISNTMLAKYKAVLIAKRVSNTI